MCRLERHIQINHYLSLPPVHSFRGSARALHMISGTPQMERRHAVVDSEFGQVISDITVCLPDYTTSLNGS